jgi:hypothetical protein
MYPPKGGVPEFKCKNGGVPEFNPKFQIYGINVPGVFYGGVSIILKHQFNQKGRILAVVEGIGRGCK